MPRLIFLVNVFAALTGAHAAEYSITSDKTGDQGIRRVTIETPYQPEPTVIRIVAPPESAVASGADAPAECRIVFVLPVEPGEQHAYGDGLAEAIKSGLHTKQNLILVAPSFTQLPWYADHTSNEKIRQDSYFIKSVLPMVDSLYPAKKPRRLLLGFSKSGFGAYSLILRRPDLFEAAAVWDAPLMKEKPDQFGMEDIFGTQENFEHYQVSKLFAEKAADFKPQTRLFLGGFGNFKKHTDEAHALLETLGIPHEFASSIYRKHIWGSGWIPVALHFLEQVSSKPR